MNYELAQELKDAGFSQRYSGDVYFQGIRIPFDAVRNSYFDNGLQVAYREYIVSIPTLEELIEACRPYFWDLVCNVGIRRGEVVVQNAEWVADARIDNITATEDTPLEAVARLWLAINKKP